MNYLAHIALSGNDDFVKIGNFMGDFVKGNKYENYSESVKQGILLHRFIDDFTDNHPKVKSDVKLISKYVGRYAPVAIDVFYDYLLCKNWQLLMEQNLDEFCVQFYDLVSKNKQLLPEKCRFMFTYMKRDNWLGNYQHIKGVEKTLNGISRRTKFNSNLDKALYFILENEDTISDGFIEFYTDLQKESKTYIDG